MSESDDDEDRRYPYLVTMNEVLNKAIEEIEEARFSDEDIQVGFHLGQAIRALKTAALIYRDHLAQNRAEMKQGESANENVSS